MLSRRRRSAPTVDTGPVLLEGVTFMGVNGARWNGTMSQNCKAVDPPMWMTEGSCCVNSAIYQ